MINDPRKEIWKDIKDYEGKDQISNLGNVKNSKNNNLLSIRNDCCWGYVFVTLNKNGKPKNYKVHRLVAKTFIPNPLNKAEVNHIDGNKLNNCVDNLEWVTRAENQKHAIKNGLVSFENKKKPVIQLKDEKEIARYKSIADVETTTGYLACNVCKCCKGKIKQYKGFHWRYAL